MEPFNPSLDPETDALVEKGKETLRNLPDESRRHLNQMEYIGTTTIHTRSPLVEIRYIDIDTNEIVDKISFVGITTFKKRRGGLSEDDFKKVETIVTKDGKDFKRVALYLKGYKTGEQQVYRHIRKQTSKYVPHTGKRETQRQQQKGFAGAGFYYKEGDRHLRKYLDKGRCTGILGQVDSVIEFREDKGTWVSPIDGFTKVIWVPKEANGYIDHHKCIKTIWADFEYHHNNTFVVRDILVNVRDIVIDPR